MTNAQLRAQIHLAHTFAIEAISNAIDKGYQCLPRDVYTDLRLVVEELNGCLTEMDRRSQDTPAEWTADWTAERASLFHDLKAQYRALPKAQAERGEGVAWNPVKGIYEPMGARTEGNFFGASR